jgi:hypothetical protein
VARLYRLVEGEHGTAIVMEAVNGTSLKDVLARHGALAPEAALAVLKGSLLGLAAAHTVGVIHRDYKPANVIVSADGHSKLIDFGIATPTGTASAAGTPSYMAPEQWQRHPATPATDVYAATCVFYECITGHHPYDTNDRAALMRGHLSEPVPMEEVPPPLRPLIERGTAKRAEQRPTGAAAFVGELEDAAQRAYGADWEVRGVAALAAAAVALAALFPLTAAGLAAPVAAAGVTAGGAGAGGAAGAGLLAGTGAKAALAAVGTAAVLATGAVAVNTLSSDEAPSRPQAAPTTSKLVGRQARFGPLSLTLPESWQVTRLMEYGEAQPAFRGSFRVDVPGRCTGNAGNYADRTTAYTLPCPGFAVLGSTWIDRQDYRSPYEPDQPFHPATDVGHICPPRPDKYHIARQDALVKRGLAAIGPRKAEYREWRMRCFDDQSNAATDLTFVQRVWYLPQSKILIVDEWNTAGLAEIFAQAVWH